MTARFKIEIHTTLPNDKTLINHWQHLQPKNSPFLHSEFLSALENTHCIGADSGWAPRYLTLTDDTGTLIALLPMFSKTHSQGEYIFDHQWADVARQNNIPYYPKLIVAIPFTPCTGNRILHSKNVTLDSVLNAAIPHIQDYAKHNGYSSIHFLFLTETENKALEKFNFFSRTGTQYHWQNNTFNTFDDFLATLKSSKRKSIKKEREKLGQTGLTFHILEGADITAEDMCHMTHFYHNTHMHKWGHAYLNDAFFNEIRTTFSEHLVLIIAKENDTTIAGSLFMKKGNTLYGRYWGAHKHVDYLHFELCYYQAIEYCIQNKLDTFEAGAQGEHKFLRGFAPTKTYSSHWIVHEGLHHVLSDYCAQERDIINNNIEYLDAISPIKELRKKDKEKKL